MKELKVIDVYSMPDTVQKPDGYNYKKMAEATTDNMTKLIESLETLTVRVNHLTEIINKITSIEKT